ncbi:hypothetical protein ABT353_21535, partial [Nonomuraea wenchangensis]
MAAQQYDAQPSQAYGAQPYEPQPPRREPMPPRREGVPPGAPGHGDQPPPRPGRRARQERADTRAVSNQDTMMAEGPRRS